MPAASQEEEAGLRQEPEASDGAKAGPRGQPVVLVPKASGKAPRQKTSGQAKAAPRVADLVFVGGKRRPLWWGISKVYTDLPNKRYRVYKEHGDKIETSFHWKSQSQSAAWNEVCCLLKQTNGDGAA